MKKWLLGVIMMALAMVLPLGLSGVCWADTLNPGMDICDDLTDDELREAAGCDVEENKTLMPIAVNIIQVVLSIVGIMAVAVIIYGGFTYMTSLGDASKVQRAKNAILYGVVGMVVALLAFTVVHFVSQSIWG